MPRKPLEEREPPEEREPWQLARPSCLLEFLKEICPALEGRGGSWKGSGYMESLRKMFSQALVRAMLEAEGKSVFTD